MSDFEILVEQLGVDRATAMDARFIVQVQGGEFRDFVNEAMRSLVDRTINYDRSE
jgi:hypothetical protein